MEDSASAPLDGGTFWLQADEMRPYLKYLVRSVMGDQLSRQTDPSSVIQRGFLAAYENRSQLRSTDKETFRRWLRSIVQREALNVVDYYNRQQRDVRREQPLAVDPSERARSVASSPDPAAIAIRREQAIRVMATLEKLQESHRTVIELRNFDGLAFEEVAERMGKSPAAVRQLWVRAVESFRQTWGEHE